MREEREEKAPGRNVRRFVLNSKYPKQEGYF